MRSLKPNAVWPMTQQRPSRVPLPLLLARARVVSMHRTRASGGGAGDPAAHRTPLCPNVNKIANIDKITFTSKLSFDILSDGTTELLKFVLRGTFFGGV